MKKSRCFAVDGPTSCAPKISAITLTPIVNLKAAETEFLPTRSRPFQNRESHARSFVAPVGTAPTSPGTSIFSPGLLLELASLIYRRNDDLYF